MFPSLCTARLGQVYEQQGWLHDGGDCIVKALAGKKECLLFLALISAKFSNMSHESTTTSRPGAISARPDRF